MLPLSPPLTWGSALGVHHGSRGDSRLVCPAERSSPTYQWSDGWLGRPEALLHFDVLSLASAATSFLRSVIQ
jgi:hypothetical protein